MLTIALVSFRETIEISLILSMVMAANYKHAKKPLIIGILLGIITSIILGLSMIKLSALFAQGGQEIFELVILSLSIILIYYSLFCIPTNLTKNLAAKNNTSYMAIIGIVGLTILREGVEIFLFIYGIMLTQGVSYYETLLASIGGICSGMLVGASIYFGLVKLPYHYLFKVTSYILMLLAAGMAARIANLLHATGIIEIGYQTLWDSSWLISARSVVGKLCNNLLGYDPTPTRLQLLFYCITLAFFLYKKHGASNPT